jgi:prepilin-type N-terminal cleavage/methylation domain-containing protein
VTSSSSHDEPEQRVAPGSGFTLLEILVVMSILAVMLGMTVGALTRSGKAGVLDGAARVVRSALERARVLALSKSSLSRVTIVPPSRTNLAPARILLEVSRVAGSWSFDGEGADQNLGGAGSTLTSFGAAPVAGFVRNGMQFTGISRMKGPPLTRAPSHDPRHGFSLEMMVKPDTAGTLASFGGDSGDSPAFALRLNADGSLAADTTVRAEIPTLTVQTRPQVIEMGQWAKVSVAHDGVELYVAAHNVIEARVADQHDVVTAPSDALVLGGGFSGVMDEVLYKTVSAQDPFEIDRQVDVKLNHPLSVRFNQDGRLNERFHDQPVEIPLAHENRTVTIKVDMAGVIR